MKIKDAINMANLMEQGNVLPKELAIFFLDRFDGMLQSDVMNYAPEEIVRYDNEEQELILRPPHDGIYVDVLVAMIRNQQQEYEGYNNTQAVVNEKLMTFKRWYVQHYRPADTDSRSYMGGTSADGFGFAYLTAYGLAVRNGYQGTEEQWLESLHGAPGDPGAPARMRYDEDREMIQWGVGEVWYDLFSLQALRDPAVDAFLREVENAASAAGQSAIAAGNSEAAARGHAKTAADAAADALTLAGQVNSACQQANKYTFEAGQSAQSASVSQTAAENAAADALGYAEDAETQAATAGDYARAAEESAKRAEAAAGNAGGGGTGDINDAIDGHNTDLAAHAPMQNNLNALRDKAISEAIDSHDTDLAAHPYFHERCNDLDDALGNKLDAGKLPEAINTALDQAKASGEFDGAKGDPGRGIESVARTSGNGAAGTTDTYTITYTDNTKSTFTVRNGTNGTNGKDGTDGQDGISPTVAVRAIDGGHQITISGAEGATAFDVMDGEDGRGIFSISRTAGDGSAGSTDIYTIKYTDNTTKQFTVKNGADGMTPHIGSNGNWYIGDTDTGIRAQGEQGNAGRGIKSITRTSGNGAAGTVDTYTITYTDGTTSTFQVRHGSNGKDGIDGTPGKDGADGKTPIKGTDYYTQADKTEMVQLVLDALPRWTGGAY